ncbi:DNA-binding response regulator [Leptolyngbya sp. BL0902]|uniref:response regulator transcription factor n=1 Tax=Leptolyngbya sp. BL0902 TaxID=1115757 RepID=UPI0018E8CD00|nr:response regulator transcription factor [Leptolyngbya sp. BL0902]QQE65001.1 DNA-binding response regulator [Leptolyngbya sp. BL0902]
MKILLMEDDAPTREHLTAILSGHRYAVDSVEDGTTGLEMAMQWPYDLLIVDWQLPSLSGLEVCQRLRQRGSQTPILMLTVRDANADIVAGLDAGADDYLAKSSEPSQLLARVRALLRRNATVADPVLRWGDLTLDPAQAQVTYQGQPISCRPKEYELLELFLRNPQRLLTRSLIIDHLWPMADAPTEGSITNLVKDVRQRLRRAGLRDHPIETVYGLGYRLRAPAVIEAPPFTPAAAPSQEAPPVVKPDVELDIKPDVKPSATTDREAGDDLALGPSLETALPPRLATALEGATQRFHIALDQRLALLEQTAAAAATHTLTAEKRQHAFAEAHRLAGGLGMFGYGQAAQAAEALELLLCPAAAQLASPQLAAQMQHHLTALKQALTHPPDGS